MKLGLLTDIHEHVDHLRAALGHFRRDQIDQIVVIGDIFEMGKNLDESCRLLTEASAIGVWGNHDFGLCVQPSDRCRSRYAPDTIRFMMSLQPRLVRWGCHFSHIEPWLDPHKIEDLWYFEGPPCQPGQVDRIFDSVPQRIIFSGHYHQWMKVSSHGIDTWRGENPIHLTDDRYFVVVGALFNGQYATFDTESFELVPFQLAGAARNEAPNHAAPH